jgi:hypothetical protein
MASGSLSNLYLCQKYWTRNHYLLLHPYLLLVTLSDSFSRWQNGDPMLVMILFG